MTLLKNYNLKPGDILFTFRKDNFLSRVIAFVTRSRFSHVALVHFVNENYAIISESTLIGVRFNLVDYYLKNKNINCEVWRHPGLSDSVRHKIVDYAYDVNKNESYGFLQLFSFLVRALLKRLRIYIKNFIRQGVVCNQYVAYGYQVSGINFLEILDPESVDQEDFYKIIQKCGFKKVLTSNGVMIKIL